MMSIKSPPYFICMQILLSIFHSVNFLKCEHTTVHIWIQDTSRVSLCVKLFEQCVVLKLKGPVCMIEEYLLSGMEYNMHN